MDRDEEPPNIFLIKDVLNGKEKYYLHESDSPIFSVFTHALGVANEKYIPSEIDEKAYKVLEKQMGYNPHYSLIGTINRDTSQVIIEHNSAFEHHTEPHPNDFTLPFKDVGVIYNKTLLEVHPANSELEIELIEIIDDHIAEIYSQDEEKQFSQEM